jgi:hypothetical protein
MGQNTIRGEYAYRNSWLKKGKLKLKKKLEVKKHVLHNRRENVSKMCTIGVKIGVNVQGGNTIFRAGGWMASRGNMANTLYVY